MAVLDDLDPAQRAAVVSEAAPLCILAAAGSGKTRVLTRRIAYRIQEGAAEAERTLALTFTRKAAGELRARLAALGAEEVTAGTFHSVALTRLRARWQQLGVAPWNVLRDPVRLVASLLADDDPGRAGAVAAEIARAKARLTVPVGHEDLYERYRQACRSRRVLDFDDLLLAYASALEDDPSFAAAERWWFRHLFVDEFQDVNPVQFRLLRAWLGDSTDLTVVGDPHQAVYGWNGADPGLLVRFTDHFPTAEVLRLDTNHRSTHEIVTVAASVLGRDGGAGPSRPPRHPGRPDARVPTLRAFHTDSEEAHGIARSLRLAHPPGAPWSDLAVLARTNAQLRLVEEALRAAGIPYRSHERDLLSVPEVRRAVRTLVETPTVVPFASALADIVDLAGEAADDSLATLLRLGREYDRFDRNPTGAGFAAWLRTVVKGDEPWAAGDAVTLATFHRAKGLEWPVVFVAGLEDGLVPLASAVTPASRAEERRLLYVALTRATRELHCSWAEHRRGPRTRSPWLGAIEHAVERLQADASEVDWRSHLARTRSRLAMAAGG